MVNPSELWASRPNIANAWSFCAGLIITIGIPWLIRREIVRRFLPANLAG
jgi:hypothetical protein